jgi:hypothetical protein
MVEDTTLKKLSVEAIFKFYENPPIGLKVISGRHTDRLVI